MRLAPLALLALVAAGPAPAPEPEKPLVVDGIDFALDWHKYVGRRVTVTGGHFYSADVSHGAVSVPGTWVHIDFKGVPRDTIKYLIQRCDMKFDKAPCTMSVTGSVASGMFDVPHLNNASIALPAP